MTSLQTTMKSVPCPREERFDHRVLRGIPFAGVSNHDKRDIFEARVAVEDQVLGELSRLALHLHPEAAFVVGRVPEDVPQSLVAGPPDGYGVDPREGRSSGR